MGSKEDGHTCWVGRKNRSTGRFSPNCYSCQDQCYMPGPAGSGQRRDWEGMTPVLHAECIPSVPCHRLLDLEWTPAVKDSSKLLVCLKDRPDRTSCKHHTSANSWPWGLGLEINPRLILIWGTSHGFTLLQPIVQSKKNVLGPAGVAQWIERRPVNQIVPVPGLIPHWGTRLGCGPGPQ